VLSTLSAAADLSGTIVSIISHFFNTNALNRVLTLSSSTKPMETKMQKRAFNRQNKMWINHTSNGHQQRMPVPVVAPPRNQVSKKP
jgi:type II secretory pathway component PulC